MKIFELKAKINDVFNAQTVSEAIKVLEMWLDANPRYTLITNRGNNGKASVKTVLIEAQEEKDNEEPAFFVPAKVLLEGLFGEKFTYNYYMCSNCKTIVDDKNISHCSTCGKRMIDRGQENGG